MVGRRWWALLCCWIASSAFAARVELSLDSPKVQIGESVGLTVSVVDGTPTAVPRVTVPPELNLQYVQQVSSSYWVNGRSTRTVKYRYQLTAAAAGDFVVGPAAVEMGTERAQTGTVELEVGDRPLGEAPTIEVKAGFDRAIAYEGQVVVYTYRLDSRQPLLGSRWQHPALDDLTPVQGAQGERKTFAIAGAQGETQVDETWVPLVASKAFPKREFSAPVVQVDLPSEDERPRGRIPDFFQVYETRRELIVGQPFSLEVKPLPEAPKGFSGLVGDFVFTASVPSEEAEVGRSFPWTVKVTGDGALDGFALPPLGEQTQVRGYDVAPEIRSTVGEKFVTEATFVRNLVPTEAGTLALEPVTVITFSPTKNRYVTHTLQVPPVRVTGSTEEAALASFREDTLEAAEPPDDISPIRRAGFTHWPRWPVVIPWVSGVLVVILSGIALLEARVWWNARQVAHELVKTAPNVSALPSDSEARWKHLDDIVKWAVAGAGFVDRESALASAEKGMAERATGLWRRLDDARFAGRQDLDLEADILAFGRERR